MSRRSTSLQLSWDEIGFLCEGLSLSSRPMRLATKRIDEEYSLGPRGAWIVLLISTGEVFPSDLTNVFHVGRSLITAELNRLLDADLITYRQSVTDGRRVELALTPLGEKVCERVKAETSKLVLKRFAAYTREEVLLCARMLREFRLGKAVEPSLRSELSHTRVAVANRASKKRKRAARAT